MDENVLEKYVWPPKNVFLASKTLWNMCSVSQGYLDQGLSKHQEMGFTPTTKCYRVMKVLKAMQGQQPMVEIIGLNM